MITDIKNAPCTELKILEGQMRGIQKIIDNEDYCMDTLTQSLAIQKSIGSLNKLIFENHVHTHIKEKLDNPTDEVQEQAVQELFALYERTNIRSK